MEISARAALEKNRFAADSAKGSSGAIHSAGHEALRTSECGNAFVAIHHLQVGQRHRVIQGVRHIFRHWRQRQMLPQWAEK
jgi:hypothetical protein